MPLPEALLVDSADGPPDPPGALERVAAEFGVDVTSRVEVPPGAGGEAAQLVRSAADSAAPDLILDGTPEPNRLAGPEINGAAVVRRPDVVPRLYPLAEDPPVVARLAGCTDAGKSGLLTALGGDTLLTHCNAVATVSGVDGALVVEGGRCPLSTHGFDSAGREVPGRGPVLAVVDIALPLPDLRRDALNLLLRFWRNRKSPDAVILTKVDLLSEGELTRRRRALMGGSRLPPERTIAISSERGEGLDDLRDLIREEW